MEEKKISKNEKTDIKELISKIEVAEVKKNEGIVFFGTCHCSGNRVRAF